MFSWYCSSACVRYIGIGVLILFCVTCSVGMALRVFQNLDDRRSHLLRFKVEFVYSHCHRGKRVSFTKKKKSNWLFSSEIVRDANFCIFLFLFSLGLLRIWFPIWTRLFLMSLEDSHVVVCNAFGKTRIHTSWCHVKTGVWFVGSTVTFSVKYISNWRMQMVCGYYFVCFAFKSWLQRILLLVICFRNDSRRTNKVFADRRHFMLFMFYMYPFAIAEICNRVLHIFSSY